MRLCLEYAILAISSNRVLVPRESCPATHFHELPLDRALKRQKELQEVIKAATETIKAAMQEIETLRQFTDVYRSSFG